MSAASVIPKDAKIFARLDGVTVADIPTNTVS